MRPLTLVLRPTWWWAATACLAGAGLLAAWTPSDDGPTVCPFALLTGVACPGCGMTRALAFLLRGRLDHAVRYHPLAAVLAIGVAAGLFWWWGRDHLGWAGWSTRVLNGVVIVFVVALLMTWVVRFATGTLPPV